VHVTVRVLDTAQHSGMASGIVPSSFRVLRTLLDRLENSETGEIRLAECNVDIPANRVARARETIEAAPGSILGTTPWHGSTKPVVDDEVELLLNNTWRPSLSIIGASGMPDPAEAGNVLRTSTTLALSFRLPPTADSQAALDAITKALTTDVPYGATVELSGVEAADGWNAPELSPWLAKAMYNVSDAVFG